LGGELRIRHEVHKRLLIPMGDWRKSEMRTDEEKKKRMQKEGARERRTGVGVLDPAKNEQFFVEGEYYLEFPQFFLASIHNNR
jgi:hypothetical protein